VAALDVPMPTDASRRAHHGPSRLEAAMEKYNKMTAEAQKKAALHKPSAKAGPERVRSTPVQLTLKQRVVKGLVSGHRGVQSSCWRHAHLLHLCLPVPHAGAMVLVVTVQVVSCHSCGNDPTDPWCVHGEQRGTWKACVGCFAADDQDRKQLDAAPINLSGIYRKVAETLGGECIV
jgi:hypothetical protein